MEAGEALGRLASVNIYVYIYIYIYIHIYIYMYRERYARNKLSKQRVRLNNSAQDLSLLEEQRMEQPMEQLMQQSAIMSQAMAKPVMHHLIPAAVSVQ